MHKDVHGTAPRKTKPHAILPLERAQIALNQAKPENWKQ